VNRAYRRFLERYHPLPAWAFYAILSLAVFTLAVLVPVMWGEW